MKTQAVHSGVQGWLLHGGQKLAATLLAAGLLATQGAALAQPGGGHQRDGRHEGRHDDKHHGKHDGRYDHGSGHGRWYDGAHGNNRYYPQPGSPVHGAPTHSRVVVWAGVNYRYLDSVWYAPGPRGYVVVRPPFGAVIIDRPAFFSLVTIGAVAYLYANGVYYREHQGGGYEVVPPPVEGLPTTAAPVKFYVYPRLNQTAERQAADEYECHQWAVAQSGFDPSAAATGQRAGALPAERGGYQRASGACLEGRGYTVR